ncbi:MULTISPECIES: DUF6392 family protein [Pseudomonas]|uniref:DUF6392 family protein n=1 Tax=Pseudomonas TaxID=286 RepID=UPI002DB5CED2|nr:DUF6392 family protein [Pseudomonas asiatica]MEB6588203.1 DUF6392 family protein [Pseudomonas asiatica]
MTRLVEVERWLGSIGKSYAELLDQGLEPNLRFIRLYPGATELYLEPYPGVSWRFDAHTKILQAIIVTLIRRVEPQPEFEGHLSQPYGCLDKPSVREAWGHPVNSRGPLKMPQPIGKTGGWDIYRLSSQGFENVELVYQYNVDLKVSGVVLRAKENEA